MKLRWVNRYTDLPPFFGDEQLQKTERVLQYWVVEQEADYDLGLVHISGGWVDVPEEEE